jgi:hypothetical protein
MNNRKGQKNMNLDSIFASLDAVTNQLTPWETNFVSSVKEQHQRRGRLSQKQVDILCRVAKSKTPEAKQAREAWTNAWTAEKADNLRVAAAYYKTTDYYQNVVDRILDNPEYVPSEKLYTAMCTNKYVKRVLDAYATDPKFNIGQMAVVKSPNRQVAHDHRALISKPVLILSVLDKILSPAKGSKMYLVASVANPLKQVELEERDLKSFKRRK